MSSRIVDPLITAVPIEKAYGTNMDVGMQKAGVYGAWRSRLSPKLTAEAGVRWDTYRYRDGLDFDAVSPRLNLVYVFETNELRAAWGVMHQPQAVNELQVEDNVAQFFRPERVKQATIGYGRRLMNGASLRVDLYDKDYDHLRARYENALDPVQLIPEGAPDRVRIDAPRARARGVEVTLRKDADRGPAGWVSYSYARAEDLDDGSWVPRSWEQVHTLSFGASWTGSLWNFSAAGLFHSGTPTTELDLARTLLPDGTWSAERVVGPRNEANLGTYARIDLRVNREVLLSNSKLSLYLEVTNLLNRKNQCCVEDFELHARAGQPWAEQEMGYYVPLLPSFGLQWEF
jgi:outer membrane receptor protein involved in Fe transport